MDTQAKQALERQPYRVNIFVPDGMKHRAFVTSPLIRIGKPPTVSTVTWTNETSRPAFLWFPNGGRVFKSKKEYLNPIIIEPGDTLTLDVRPDPDEGDYHYHVYCEAIHDCAQGNSEPRLSVP